MPKSILLAGDSTSWVHLAGEGRPTVLSFGGLKILEDLIRMWCSEGASVLSPVTSGPLAEYFEWERSDRFWRPVRRMGTDEPPPIQMQDGLHFPRPDVLVLLDLGLGFASHPDWWPEALRDELPKRVVLVSHSLPASALAARDAFTLRLQTLSDRLTMIVSADLLRGRGATISRGLSWDRTIEETAREMTKGLSAADLGLNYRTIITFGTSGAAIFDRKEMVRAIYDSTRFENLSGPNELELHLLADLAVGAAATRHECNSRDNPLFVALCDALNFADTCERGVGDLSGSGLTGFWRAEAEAALTTLEAPRKHGRVFYSTFRHGILSDSVFSSQLATCSDLLRDATGAGLGYIEAKATEIVLFGTKVLDAVPSARFGKFFTVDREEIEGLQTIRRQIQNYRANEKIERPLSLAVFGQPGSGKSFAIKQLAEELLGRVAQLFEFNLTQFQKWEDLVLSFHQIRDAAAKRRMPFVFWDEFDTDDFKWLKHFLGPMQDAEFHSAGHAFPFGRGVFVFAGGVAYKMADFQEKVRTAHKGPDFVSRLHGYLNIKGPNPVRSEKSATKKITVEEDDPAHVIRRAIMLRSAIERYQAHILDSSGRADISPGVIRAFLRVNEFRHGMRSLEALVSQSQMTKSFGPSDLPPPAVLQLHVDEESFEDQKRLGLLGSEVIEALAKACHDSWWRQKREGLLENPHSQEAEAHELLKDYDSAPDRHKESSRKTARVTEAKLEALGYRVARKGEGAPVSLGGPELMRLVEIEHDIWLRDYLQRGYEQAIETRDILFQHQCICRFTELSAANQKLDLAIAVSIEPTLSKLGYQLVRKELN
jgi:hypothetical protein